MASLDRGDRKAEESAFYDTVEDMDRCPYFLSRYFPLWAQILLFLNKVPTPRVLEIGCGTGGLAQMLHEYGFRDYHGFDFSERRLDVARSMSPQSFSRGDAREKRSYEGDYNVAICCEVLEHLDDDLAVLRQLRPGTTLILSLPTFWSRSHLRCFRSPAEIERRYRELVAFRKIVPIGKWFVGIGVVRETPEPPGFLWAKYEAWKMGFRRLRYLWRSRSRRTGSPSTERTD